MRVKEKVKDLQEEEWVNTEKENYHSHSNNE